ncbi:MAG: hypothetical protein OIF58_01860 [Cohaesibacter sp.]|nr:hypothetical protein [Cohaesibacter sp.]
MSTLMITGLVLAALVLVGFLGSRFVIQFIATMFTRPNRQALVKNPADYGLSYEDVSIKTQDGVTLSAWLMRGTNEKVIILGHPGTFTRYGYSLKHETLFKSGYSKDVEFLPAVKHLVDAGYSVLMYDQRNHGQSGASDRPHDLSGHVYWDAVAVAEFMANHPDFKGQDIGLFAICMNSMINAIAMTKEPERMKKANVKAMTIIQPHSVDLWLSRSGIPNWVLKGADKIYRKRGVTPLADWNPIGNMKHIFVPALFVQNLHDKTSDMDHMREIFSVIPTEKTAIWIDEPDEDHSRHRFHTYNWFNHHPQPLLDFFGRYLK